MGLGERAFIIRSSPFHVSDLYSLSCFPTLGALEHAMWPSWSLGACLNAVSSGLDRSILIRQLE